MVEPSASKAEVRPRDNSDALDIVSIALTGAGAMVRVAHSGATALALFNERPPDVVLCDLAMPEMDGFTVLREIRSLDRTRGRLTPVLAVSAYASAEDRARSLRAGFQAHLSKPCNGIELVTAVADAVTRV